MNRTSQFVLVSLMYFAASSLPSFAAPISPTPISEFKRDFRVQFAKTGSPEATSITTDNGEVVVKVQERAKLFPGMGITLNGFDGMKSVCVSFEVKTVNIARNATMAYYWTNSSGKKLTSDRVPIKVAGTTEWTRYEKVLSSPLPLETGGIRIRFLVWAADSDGYALFRKPSIRIATPEDGARIKEASVAPPPQRTKISPSAESFSCRFTNKIRGASYDVERGGYGWFMLWAKQPLKDIAQVRITAPDALAFELYLFREGKAEFVSGSSTPGNLSRTWAFEGLDRYRWNCWGNVVLFRVGPDAPESFDISLTFADRHAKPFFTETIPVRVLEPLNLAPSTTAFENRVYYAHPFRWIAFDDARAVLANGLLGYLESRGFSSAGYLTEAKTQSFAEEKGEVITQFTRMPYRFNRSSTMTAMLKKHGIPMAMAASGVRSATELETQVVADKGLAFYAEMLRATGNEVYRGRRLVWLNDYEPYAYEGPATQYSFAPESLAAFRTFVALPEGVKLTPRTILTEYPKQWVAFRCRQHALVIKAQVEALKAYSPQGVYALSSESLPGKDEEAQEFFRRYGVDLRMMDSYVDMHVPMIYSRNATYYRRVEATVAQLTKPVFPTITCGYGNSIRDPKRLRRLMVAAAFLGSRGVYHWPGFWGMDGHEMQSSQQAMALIARLEPFLTSSELVQRKNHVTCSEAKSEHLYHAIRSSDEEHLVFIANDGKNSTYYPLVRFPDATQALAVSTYPEARLLSPDTNPQTHTQEQLRKGLRVKIAPSSMTILRFSPKLPVPVGSVMDVRAWEREYRATVAATADRSRGRTEKGMSYRLSGTTLQIKTPSQYLNLSMDDCGVGEWSLRDAGERRLLLHFLGREHFDFPGAMRLSDIPVEIEKAVFRDDALEVVVYYRVNIVPYEGLALRKTFVVARNMPKVSVSLEIIPADGFRQFALRVVHGINAPGSLFRVDGLNCPPCSKSLAGNVYTRAGTDFTPFIQSKLISKIGTFRQDQCGLLLPGGKWVAECDIEDRVRGLMNWHGDTVDTMELLYDKAYDHNDPHRAAMWKCTYTLQARRAEP